MTKIPMILFIALGKENTLDSVGKTITAAKCTTNIQGSLGKKKKTKWE